jgi:hypothetical protein
MSNNIAADDTAKSGMPDPGHPFDRDDFDPVELAKHKAQMLKCAGFQKEDPNGGTTEGMEGRLDKEEKQRQNEEYHASQAAILAGDEPVEEKPETPIVLKINEDFKKLIPPLTEEEFEQLAKNILEEGGIRDAICTWDGFIIDGHNRHEIAQKHDLEYRTKELEFNDEDAVKEWMVMNQLGRRNLLPYSRSLLALKLEGIFRAKAKVKQSEGGGAVKEISPEAVVETRKELAKIANVSDNTITRVKKIEEKAPAELKEKLSNGIVSVNEAYKEVTSTPVDKKSDKNECRTPIHIIDMVKKVFEGSIDLDPASSSIINKKIEATQIFTIDDDGLSKKWEDNVWVCPPQTEPLISKFCAKIVAEQKNYKSCIVMVENATETKCFQKICTIASAICFPSGKVKFWNLDKTSASLKSQAIIYIGGQPDLFIEVFKEKGTTWRKEEL